MHLISKTFGYMLAVFAMALPFSTAAVQFVTVAPASPPVPPSSSSTPAVATTAPGLKIQTYTLPAGLVVLSLNNGNTWFCNSSSAMQATWNGQAFSAPAPTPTASCVSIGSIGASGLGYQTSSATTNNLFIINLSTSTVFECAVGNVNNSQPAGKCLVVGNLTNM